MKVYPLTLPNALRTLIVDTGGAESATVLLLVGAGSRYENTRNNGIAHFFEHMAFKGSKKYADSFTISSTIDGMGGVFNAFTSKDHTGYWIKGTADKTGLMLDVLADMISSAKLEDNEIEKEKGVIIEEINMYEDMPQHKVSQVYDAILYPNHSLGMDIAGTHETVKSFGRQDFVNYIQKLYHPDNAVLVVSGGIGKEVERIRDEVAKTFGQWDTGSGVLRQYDFDNYQGAQSKKVSKIHKKNTEQAHFVMGYTTDYGFLDERKYPLAVLAAILGGGMSSRLFVEIREKRGLCYYVHTSRDMYAETGSLVTSAGVRCDSKVVNEALKVIVEQHEMIASGKETDKLQTEIQRVKEMLKGRLLLSLEDSQSVAGFYGNKLLLEGSYLEPQKVIKLLDEVTIEDVISEAKSIVIDDRLRLAVIGPFEEGEIIV